MWSWPEEEGLGGSTEATGFGDDELLFARVTCTSEASFTTFGEIS